MIQKVIFTAFSLLLSTSLLFPAASKSSFTPYYGKTYSQPEQVLAMYPNPDVEFDTPAFNKDEESFTTQEEMEAFLNELDQESTLAEMKIIGKSIEGRDIPMLVFQKGSDTENKPTVWIQAQIHGDEPAAGEAALVMAQMLTKEYGEELLEKINVVIVPRVNPDGMYRFQRYAENGLDGNRDHMKLELPEVRAVHKAMNAYYPEVVIQLHEYSVYDSDFDHIGDEGALKYHDVMVLSGRNLNTPKQLKEYADGDDGFIQSTSNQLAKFGYSDRSYYYAIGVNGEKPLISEGKGLLRTGRNIYGVQPSFSFLVESRGIGIGRESFKRRVHGQIVSQTSLLNHTAENASKVAQMVSQSREDITEKGKNTNDDDKIVVESKRKVYKDKSLTVVDIAKGETKEIPVDYKSSEDSIPLLERERPRAYIMPPGNDEVVEKLQNLGVEVKQLIKPLNVDVESYTVSDQVKSSIAYEGHYRNWVKTEINEKKIHFPTGSYLFDMAQPRANLIALALEPEADDSYVTFNFIPAELDEEISVYRLMEELPSSLNCVTVE